MPQSHLCRLPLSAAVSPLSTHPSTQAVAGLTPSLIRSAEKSVHGCDEGREGKTKRREKIVVLVSLTRQLDLLICRPASR